MPKPDRTEYQKKYYQKIKKQNGGVYCDACEKIVLFYKVHFNSARHQKNEAKYRNKMFGNDE